MLVSLWLTAAHPRISKQKANHLDIFPEDHAFPPGSLMTGVDEAGRGCLAGPVVVASVSWDPHRFRNYDWFQHIGDSKTLSPEDRAKLYPLINQHAAKVRVAVLGNIVIDYLNILRATLHGFELVTATCPSEEPIVIDGNQKPPTMKHAATMVKGDAKLSAVAAASIIAKYFRDSLIIRAAQIYPGYGLEQHKGYAVKSHFAAIRELGPCAIHRKSFRPIADLTFPPTNEEAVLLAEIQTAPAGELNGLWQAFRAGYHTFSRESCIKLIEGFQTRRFDVIPSPRSLRAPL